MPENKSKDALRTIGEVALQTGVSAHILRFWENKFMQIRPQKRRGRRYYSAQDIEKIQTIKGLLYEQGYTIRGVHKFLKNTNNSHDIIAANKDVQNIQKDLFGNAIANAHTTDSLHPEFGAVEFAKLWQIYRGLCALRTRLNVA